MKAILINTLFAIQYRWIHDYIYWICNYIVHMADSQVLYFVCESELDFISFIVLVGWWKVANIDIMLSTVSWNFEPPLSHCLLRMCN